MSAPATAVELSKRLVALVGAVAAAGLATTTPLYESGRTVEATVQPDQSIAVRHVAGREYLRAYIDAVGVPTICDGSTKGVHAYQTATREQCLVRLMQDLVDHAEPVMKCVPELAEPGRDFQRWAAISLAVNIGAPRFCGSTAATRFRAHQWRAGCDAIVLWDKGTVGRRKVVLPGLVKRRAAERGICLRGVA